MILKANYEIVRNFIIFTCLHQFIDASLYAFRNGWKTLKIVRNMNHTKVHKV